MMPSQITLLVDGKILIGPAACINMYMKTNQGYMDVTSSYNAHYSAHMRSVVAAKHICIILEIAESMGQNDANAILSRQMRVGTGSVFHNEVILEVTTEDRLTRYTSNFLVVSDVCPSSTSLTSYSHNGLQHYEVKLSFGPLGVTEQEKDIGVTLRESYYVHIPNPYSDMVDIIEEERRAQAVKLL